MIILVAIAILFGYALGITAMIIIGVISLGRTKL